MNPDSFVRVEVHMCYLCCQSRGSSALQNWPVSIWNDSCTSQNIYSEIDQWSVSDCVNQTDQKDVINKASFWYDHGSRITCYAKNQYVSIVVLAFSWFILFLPHKVANVTVCKSHAKTKHILLRMISHVQLAGSVHLGAPSAHSHHKWLECGRTQHQTTGEQVDLRESSTNLVFLPDLATGGPELANYHCLYR